jgi:hypothetical protein
MASISNSFSLIAAVSFSVSSSNFLLYPTAASLCFAKLSNSY